MGEETKPATLDETYRTLCGALLWAYTPDASLESVAIAAEAASNELLWHKNQRADELQALRRVVGERDALLAFVRDYVREGCHHSCPEGDCSHRGNLRMARAKELLAAALGEG